MGSRVLLGGPGYQASPDFVVRVPLLAVEDYERLHDPAHRQALLADGLTRTAILCSSISLYEELARLGWAESDAIRAGVTKYLSRMAMRSTPFGLSAGVSIGKWGAAATLSLADGPPRARLRVDSGWLFARVLPFELDLQVLPNLFVWTNPAIHSTTDRYYAENTPVRSATDTPDAVSIRRTPMVDDVLAKATRPIQCRTLYHRWRRQNPNLDPSRVWTVLRTLVHLGFLITDLRCSPTAESLEEAVARPLERSACTRPMASEILAYARCARTVALCEPTRLHALCTRLIDEQPTHTHPIQIDSAVRVSGNQLPVSVADEARTAVGHLLRMHPYPAGPPAVVAYRERFVERYGENVRVPLSLVGTKDHGLGPVRHAVAAAVPLRTAAARADRMLIEIANRALAERSIEIEVDEPLLRTLSDSTSPHWAPPNSVELHAYIGARSAAAVAAGDYQLVVAPNGLVIGAGRGLSRFVHVLGSPARRLLERLQPSASDGEDTVFAELIYLPTKLRSTNLLIRPQLARHAVYVNAFPSAARDAISLTDISVAVVDNCFRLYWEPAGLHLKIVNTHMLTTERAPAAAKLLMDLNLDGMPYGGSFDWRGARDLLFLPRLRTGKSVLSPATWRLPTQHKLVSVAKRGGQAWLMAVQEWQRHWMVPRLIWLGEFDQRLAIDLQSAEQLELFRSAVRRADSDVLISELLPAPADAWLPGPRGRYNAEFVFPFTLGRLGATHPRTAETATHHLDSVRERMTVPPLGGTWLFLKLYASDTVEDRILINFVHPFVNELRSERLLRKWFFVRYADPHSHIRLRIECASAASRRDLIERVAAWSKTLLASACANVSFDSYRREIGRYGGPEGMSICEEIFWIDSENTLSIVKQDYASSERWILAATSGDALLTHLGLSADRRLSLYRSASERSIRSGEMYRAHKAALREGIGRINSVDSRSHSRLLRLGRRLNRVLAGNPHDVYRSLLHMHFNRTLGDRAAEPDLLAVLARVQAGLLRPRVRRTPPLNRRR